MKNREMVTNTILSAMEAFASDVVHTKGNSYILVGERTGVEVELQNGDWYWVIEA